MMSRIFSRHRRRQRRGEQQQQQQQDELNPPPLLQLPWHILTHLLRTLPAPAAAALALTCRRLWTLAGSAMADVRPLKQLLTTRDQRLEFLYPQQGCLKWRKHVFCHDCVRFHRRIWPITTQHCYRDRCYWLRYSYYDTIPFMRVADMMNRHRYGPEFGIPTYYFEYNFRKNGVSRHGLIHTIRSLRMRVVDDMAIAMLDVSEIVPTRLYRDPATVYWSHRALLIRLLDQLDGGKEGGARQKVVSAYARCGHCNADVRLVADISRKTYVHRRSTVWIPLGTCERRDAIWERALTDCFYPHAEQVEGPEAFVWSKSFSNDDKAPLLCPEKRPYLIDLGDCRPTINGKRTPLPRPRGRASWNQNVHT